MDQERFDQLAKKLYAGSSRRKVLGGAIAGLFAGATASLAEAKNKSGKADHKNKNKNGKADHKKQKADGKKKVTVKTLNGEAFEVAEDQIIQCGPGTCTQGCCAYTGLPPVAPATTAPGVCVTNGSGGQFCVKPTAPFFLPGQECALLPPGVVFNPLGCCQADGTPNTSGPLTGRCGTNAISCAACTAGCCGGTNNGTCNTNGQGGFCVNPLAAGFVLSQNCPVGVAPVGGVTNCVVSGAGGVNGCCSTGGTCNPGNVNPACGANGQICTDCVNPLTCVSQSCRAIIPPPVPPPPPAAVGCGSGLTACAAGCKNLLTDNTNCGACTRSCGGRACNNGVCARKKHKKHKKH